MKILNTIVILLSISFTSCGPTSAAPFSKPQRPDPIIVTPNSTGATSYSPERARGFRAIFEMHCKAGNEPYCVELAKMLIAGLGGEKQEERAKLLIENACKKEYEPACAQLRR